MNENMNMNEVNEEVETVNNESNEPATETEQVVEAEQAEERIPTFSENLTNDLSNGLHSVLYKRINNITIADARIADVFSRFLKEVECGKTFRIIDIISSAESVVKNKEPKENAGAEIYCYDHINIKDKNVSAKLLENSVGGIYTLFAIHNGLALDIDAIGSSVPAAEAKRYLILPPKKVAKILEIARYNQIPLAKAGEVITDNKIYLARNNQVIAEVDKNCIESEAPVSVAITAQHYASFVAGYNAVSALLLCNCVGGNNVIRFGIGEDVAAVCAKALGMYAALTYLKTLPVRMVYTKEATVTVAVSRPQVADGDYLYLLKLRNDENGLPEKAHYGQLYYYLNEKKRVGIIKDVLPLRENVSRVIERLSRADLEYVSLASVPENCFGVIVSVGRGESVNGMKLGYFKAVQ